MYIKMFLAQYTRLLSSDYVEVQNIGFNLLLITLK